MHGPHVLGDLGLPVLQPPDQVGWVEAKEGAQAEVRNRRLGHPETDCLITDAEQPADLGGGERERDRDAQSSSAVYEWKYSVLVE